MGFFPVTRNEVFPLVHVMVISLNLVDLALATVDGVVSGVFTGADIVGEGEAATVGAFD